MRKAKTAAVFLVVALALGVLLAGCATKAAGSQTAPDASSMTGEINSIPGDVSGSDLVDADLANTSADNLDVNLFG
jgi:hypothetical protein